MKPLHTVLITVAVILLLAVFSFMGKYNQLVARDEAVKTAWAQVENVYQRRLDLIPNLVATVKGYAAHEQKTLQGVVEARAKLTQVSLTSDAINNPETLQKFQALQSQMSGALSRLLAVAEQYPDLKANQNFLALQTQLEGTENRIAVERNRFNEAAQAFNTMRRTFPASMIANLFGFKEKSYFKAEAEAAKAPKVEF